MISLEFYLRQITFQIVLLTKKKFPMYFFDFFMVLTEIKLTNTYF